MKKINLDRDWKFILDKDCGMYVSYGFRKCNGATGPAAVGYHEGMMRSVDLPHDWGIELLPDRRANTANGARPVNTYVPIWRSPDCDAHIECSPVGWYRKHFSVENMFENQRVYLEFEGVFRNYDVFVNGIYIDHHSSGYTAAVFDITDQVHISEDNVIAVRVDASQPEGWWYEGAGIYRHVNLIIKDEVYIPNYTTFVKTKNTGEVDINTAVYNSSSQSKNLNIQCRILDKEGICVEEKSVCVDALSHTETKCSFACDIKSPNLWNIDSPYLYTAELFINSNIAESVKFGFREITFDADKGMFLNGKHIKVHGACIHQDFGGFGVALPESISRYKIELLKNMGVNAYRSSHHPASEDVLKACDELGMLVIDEARIFGSSPEALRQIGDMVSQHRNHPCIFLWSLGNEEYQGNIQSTDFGGKMGRTACEYIKSLDNTRLITFGADNGCVHKGVNSVVDVRGFNYIRNMDLRTHDENGNYVPGYHPDRYHAEHPDVVILGTEEASHFLCRDAGFDNYEKGQLSPIGENTMRGGSTPEGWVKFYEKRDYLVGGFMWTGIDYYGEPSPFTDINLSSSFGAIDLVGFPKNSYYYYRSCWIDEPMIKIMPHWDFKKGDVVKIAVYTNCENVTLYLNQKKIGEKKIEKFDSAIWDVPFESGRLEAVGARNGIEYRTSICTPKTPQRLIINTDKSGINADDIVIADVMITDAEGNICCNADREVLFDVEGNGKIIGIGNGNPSSFEPDKYLETIERIDITDFYISRNGEKKEKYIIPDESDMSYVENINGIDKRFKSVSFEPKNPVYEDEYRLVWTDKSKDEYERSFVFEADIDNADGFEFIQFERLFGAYEIYLNGELIASTPKGNRSIGISSYLAVPYRFYCKFKSGVNHLEVHMSGKNTSQLGIYNGVSIGKFVQPTWKRKTFYGKLRVFVQAKDTGSFTISATAEELEPAEKSINIGIN